MDITLNALKLMMVERNQFNSKEDGRLIVFYKCTFQDKDLFTFVFNSSDERFAKLVGQKGDLVINYSQDTFGGKVNHKMKIVDFAESD